jgi:hypothetical protein
MTDPQPELLTAEKLDLMGTTYTKTSTERKIRIWRFILAMRRTLTSEQSKRIAGPVPPE